MKKLFVIALAAIGMAACTQEELVSIKGGDAIVFDDAFLDNATRAGAVDPSITTANIDGFKVWAFMDDVNGTVFEAEKVTKSGDAWTYANTQYWTPNHTYYFAALAPIGGNWTLNTDNASTLGAGIVNFINADGGEDLIYAKQIVRTPADINAQPAAVKLQFQHLLSKVKFTFKNGFANANTKLVVKNIQMTAPQGGSIDLAVADYSKGWNLNGTDVAYAYGDLQSAIKGLDAKAESATERLMIPAAADHLYTITFDVELYMGDVLAQTFPGRKTQIMGVELAMGKAYNFTATLTPQNIVDEESTLYPITFDVEVDEWDTQADKEVALNTYYVKTAAELAEALTSDAGEINVTLLENIDIAISTLGQQTGGSGEYKLGGKGTEKLNIDLGGKKLNITTTYWSALGCNNDNAVITIKNGEMTSTGNSAGTWNAWDLRFENCNYVFEDVKFLKAVALSNVGKTTTMKNVTITDTHNTDTYGLWISAEGQTVNLVNCTIDMLPASDGRGIKIDEQYVGNDTKAKVTLNVTNLTVKSEEKSAILVKSAKGAEINVNGINITEVAEDTTNAVWVDEDAAQYAGLVVVNGALCKVEGAVAVTGTDIAGALATSDIVTIPAGTYTFPNGLDNENIIICEDGVVFEGSSNLNVGGATIIGGTFSNPSGSVVSNTINGTFKGCTFSGSNALRYTYAGDTVVFEDCVFDGNVYGIHFDGGANDVIFKNCTISGFNALGADLTMVTFEGCTFEGNGKSGYNGANLWGSAKLINCEFTFDGSTSNEWIDCIGVGKTYEFENCTVNGVAYTPASYTNYGDIFSRNGVTVKINGVDCAL